MRIVQIGALALGGLLAGAAGAEEKMFEPPMHAGRRVDICRVWGSECGQPAADEFCRLQGFERADFFSVDHDIGAATPTRTLADGKVCDQGFCDGFGAIHCVRAAGAPSSGTPPATQPQRPGRLKLPGWATAPATKPNDTPLSDPGQSVDPGAGEDPHYPPGVLPDEPPPSPPPPPAEPPAPAAPVFGEPPWTPKDVMRPNVDVQAQYALFRLLKGDAGQRTEASHILSALQAGALQGIYQEDQQAPALRAQALGQWWGQILPKGVDGVCMKQPAGKTPLIAMRRGAPADRASYDQALLAAWQQCAIPHNYPLRRYDPAAGGGGAEPAGAKANGLQCQDDGEQATLHAGCESAFQFNLKFCEKVKAHYALQVVQGEVIDTYDKCITRISSMREQCHWITDNEICRR